MLHQLSASPNEGWRFVDALYRELLDTGVRYFFPDFRLEPLSRTGSQEFELAYDRVQPQLGIQWLGQKYTVRELPGPLTKQELQLISSIGRVLSARYIALSNTTLAAQAFQLFRGLPEDRYVSSFLDPDLYGNSDSLTHNTDWIANAIEVLRIAASTTYENRRIATGVLLVGDMNASFSLPDTSNGLPYTTSLTRAISFHRLCDGLQTLALVDAKGQLAELIDIQEWAKARPSANLPVPPVSRYEPHCRATLEGGRVCLVLSPAGEIKVFANGAQVFNFLGGKWHLTDAEAKYALWTQAVGDLDLAQRLFTAALNMAEDRRGGLFVLVNNRVEARDLLCREDLLTSRGDTGDGATAPSHRDFHYLLRGKRVREMSPTVLESIARMDGAIVLDRSSALLAFGAIIQHDRRTDHDSTVVEGGRTTAAITASRVGKALKISEDGVVSFYSMGRRVWTM
jgi:hypothetical protein